METDAFKAALTRIGFNNQARDAVVSQGFPNIDSLARVDKSRIKQLCKMLHEDQENPIEISLMNKQLLEAMRFWVINRNRLGLIYEFYTIHRGNGL